MKDIEKIDAALDIIKKSKVSNDAKKTAEFMRDGIFHRLEMCEDDSLGCMKFSVSGYCACWNQFIIMMFAEGAEGILGLGVEDPFAMVKDFLEGYERYA